MSAAGGPGVVPPPAVCGGTAPSLTTRRDWLRTVAIGFLCVFAALALPSRGFGPIYTRAHAALGNALVGGEATKTGVTLRFSATDAELAAAPWHTTLQARAGDGRRASFPIDLRSLAYLPTAAFLALAFAIPLASVRKNLVVAGVGLLVLGPLQLSLISLPLLSLLSGDGPFLAFELAPSVRLAIHVAYRALVAPPGMTYALPLFLLWILATTLGRTRAVTSGR